MLFSVRGIGVLALCGIILGTRPGIAHEEIALQVAELTRRIGKDPGDATLFLRRAELHRHHRDWPAALADYCRASQLEPGLEEVHLCLGTMLLDAGLPEPALAALDRFLSRRPRSACAILLRARALLGLGSRLAAAHEFTRGFDLLPVSRPPRPDDYIDRARALAAEGPAHVDAAIRGLDEGIRRLRGAVALQLLAVDLEVSRGRYDDALARLRRIEAASPRKERWIIRRGEVLAEAGRLDEARAALGDARAAIAALPARLQSTRAVVDLDARVQAALRRMEPPGSSRIAAGKP